MMPRNLTLGLSAIAAVILPTVLIVANTDAQPPSKGCPPAGQGPSSSLPPDPLRSAIDPYTPDDERNRFVRAAGQDAELNQAEFAADLERLDGFVQPFETWSALRRFDKNDNRALDWYEADAYRRSLRQHIFAKFDTDKDQKLTGEERVRANRALESKRLPPDQVEITVGAHPEVNTDGDAGRVRAPPLRLVGAPPEVDTDGDGRSSDEEVRAFQQREREAWQKQLEQNRRNVLAAHDKNGNGELDPAERQAFVDSLRRMFQMRHDKNGDGQLDGEELAAWEKSRDRRFIELREQHDADGDGLMNYDEAHKFYRAMKGPEVFPPYQEEIRRLAWEVEKPYDTDGDGKLNKEESAVMRQALRAAKEARSLPPPPSSP